MIDKAMINQAPVYVPANRVVFCKVSSSLRTLLPLPGGDPVA